MTPRKRAKPVEPAPQASTTASPAAVEPLFVVPLDIRWRDLDAFNHVNNSTYLTYLEEARLRWLQQVRDWFSEGAVPVMAASTLNYRRPIEWPARLQVQLFCERAGGSSLTLGHRIVDAADGDRLYCDGHVVMVWIDPRSGTSCPLPSSIRDAAAQLLGNAARAP